jgi:hypothetical protein
MMGRSCNSSLHRTIHDEVFPPEALEAFQERNPTPTGCSSETTDEIRGSSTGKGKADCVDELEN